LRQSRADWHPWLWLNLLGLDAPLIALVWQDYLGRLYPSTLFPAGRIVLALTVWAIYLADRLLDVRDAPSGLERERHRFCRDHRAFARTLLILVLCADIVTACVWLRPAVFKYGLPVLAGVVLYFGAFPVTRRGMAAWKKPVAALLFTAGIFIVPWAVISHPWRLIGGMAAAFFALCLSNLLAIENWEQGRELQHGWIWMAGISAGCIGWCWPVSLSAAGLAILSIGDNRISASPGSESVRSASVRCVLADAVLLSPLLFR
jgi:hypothetical protein